jgi:hypothetical protein
MRQYSESRQLTIKYFEEGGSGDPIPTDQDGLIKQVNHLPTLAKEDPQYWTIALHRYDDLPSWPGMKGEWAFADYATIALGAIADQYNKLVSLHESVVAMQAHPDEYILGHGVELADLTPLETDLLGHVKNIAQKAEDCLQSKGTDCKLDPADQISDYEYRIKLPVRRGSFAEDTALSNARSTQEAKQNALKALIQQLTTGSKDNFVRNGMSNILASRPDLVNQMATKERAELDQANQALANLEPAYPEDLRRAILTQWIKIPVKARCDADYTRSDCIDSEKIESYGKRIVTK